MSRPAALPYFWMLCGAACFAVMAAMTTALKDTYDWQWIAVARTGLAMIFAAGLATAGGAKLVFLKPGKLWTRSIAGSVSLLCSFYAMTHYATADDHYATSEIVTLFNMFPLWVALLSWPLLGESPPLDVWPAVIVGLVGIALMQQPEWGGAQVAVAAAIFCSFTSAIALIGLHQLKEIDPRAIVAHFSAVALAGCIAALFLFPRTKPLALDLFSGALLLGVGGFATAGQLFLTKAFASGPPARVSVVGLAQVGFTMLLEIAIWQRHYSLWTLLGIVLVIAPTAWTLLRAGQKPREVAA